MPRHSQSLLVRSRSPSLPTADSPWRPICSPTPSCDIAERNRHSKRPNCSCPEFLTMPRIEPGLVPVVTDLERGLRELGVPFAIVGALVPELLLDARPARMTNDDATIVVQALPISRTQAICGSASLARLPHRMQHRSGGLVDLLPFSESIA